MNTAGRLLAIYDRLLNLGQGPDTAMVNLWAKVFEIVPDGPHLEDEVVTCLQAMRSEIALLQTKLDARGVPLSLVRQATSRLRDLTSTGVINAGWFGLRDMASKPENRVELDWARWALGSDTEDDLEDGDLADLLEDLGALEQSLSEAGMSPYLRGFVQRQIDAIRSALRIYKVQGVKPIEEALRQVAGSYTIEKQVVEAEARQASEPVKGVLSRTAKIIEKTAKVADNLDKIRKAGEGAYTLTTTVGPLLLNWGKNLINGGGN